VLGQCALARRLRAEPVLFAVPSRRFGHVVDTGGD
jgi:hypothetical protein